MAFFRVKKIKGKEYAYLVENEWKRKGSRQKVKGYLGRAYRLSQTNKTDFSGLINNNEIEKYIQDNDANKIIKDLIEWELINFNVDRNEFSIDLTNRTLQRHKKNAVLVMNEGFMCDLTLSNLLEFKPEADEDSNGYNFARAFVEAGIKVPQDVFIGLFAKLYKIDNKRVE
ncbi:MAG TPA: hypothetical protein VJI52_04180 [Candidatus Nanoarchaeia archaeon]|nr:hypothetical protein [Candidatus Nanoarchaeia archaeon]